MEAGLIYTLLLKVL